MRVLVVLSKGDKKVVCREETEGTTLLTKGKYLI